MSEPDFNLFDFLDKNSLKPKFEETSRDVAKEKKIWEAFIQPIVRDYKLYWYGDTLFEYEETKKPSFFSSDDLEDMQRSVLFFTMELDWDTVYSPGEKKEYFFLDDVLGVLSGKASDYVNGSLHPEIDRNIINLKDKFLEYLKGIFDSNSLPVFLEILSREPGASKASNPSNQEQKNKEVFSKLSTQCSIENDPTTNQDDKEKVPQVQKDTMQNTKYYTERQFFKYVEVARKFCQGFIDQGKQPASKKETQEYIEKCLEGSKESLGPNSRLPERLFREIWQAVPDELKRKRGVTTRR